MSKSKRRRTEHFSFQYRGTPSKQDHNRDRQDLDVLLKRTEALCDEVMKLEEHENYLQKEAINGIKKDAQSIKETIVHHQDEIKPLGDSTPTTNNSEETRLKNELKDSQEKNRDLQDKVNNLEKRVIELEKKVIELKEDKEKLEIRQVAFVFEQAVATYVYPEHKQIGDVEVYKRMKAWLEKEKKKKTKDGKEANARLNHLITKWQLSKKHEDLKSKLKKSGKGAAHPPIFPKDLKIPDDLDETEKKCFEDFIEIIDFVWPDAVI